MIRTIDMKPWIVVCWVWVTGVVQGGECWPGKDCWNHPQNAPQTKLSDLGVVGFMSLARVAVVDAEVEASLSQIRTKMGFSSQPEKVVSGEENIPATWAEAAHYLARNVCMAFPPVLCAETSDAFFFSGGTSTIPVYDFGSGIAILKTDGSIWTWTREDATVPPAGSEDVGSSKEEPDAHD